MSKKQILSYNVNGIRAALNKGFAEWLQTANPFMLSVQETKAQPSQVNQALFEHLGYKVYLHSAQKKGYSGLMTLLKEEPDNFIIGMDNEKYDSEGRVMRFDYGDLTFVNVYIPSGSSGDNRQKFKMEFLADFKLFLDSLKAQNRQLVISGDFNICHKPIDINHPEKHTKISGFLPEERQWFDELIDDNFTDTFREFNKEPEQYSWWTYRGNSRARNVGWRIDYHIISNSLKNQLQGADILSEVKHSDHCPVLVELNF